MLKTATTAAFVALFLSSVPAMAVDPAVKCESGKLKVASKYAACLLKAESKAVAKGTTADYGKCDSKFSDKFASTEEKAGGMCPSEGDETAIQDFLAACDASVIDALAGGALLLDPVTCDGALDACDTASGTCEADLAVCNTDLPLCFDGWLDCIDDQVVANAGTAGPGDVLAGRTFTSASGLGVTGTVPAGSNLVGDGILSGYIPAALYDGTTTIVLSDSDLVAGNVRNGVDIFGVLGTFGAPATCLNGLSEAGETCDGADLNGETCATQAPSTPHGTLSCNGTCDGFLTAACEARFDASGATIIDHETRLEWEKKTDNCPSDFHFVGNHTTGTFDMTINAAGTSFTAVVTDASFGSGSVSAGTVSGSSFSGPAFFPSAMLSVNMDGTIDCELGEVTLGGGQFTSFAVAGVGPDPRDVANRYTWTGGTTAPDGTAFTEFLDKLNGGLGDNTCYAGHCDWRLPTIEELQSITIPDPTCGASPCVVDSAFLPTLPRNHWSSSTNPDFTLSAWVVNFSLGSLNNRNKLGRNGVRAVRAGS